MFSFLLCFFFYCFYSTIICCNMINLLYVFPIITYFFYILISSNLSLEITKLTNLTNWQHFTSFLLSFHYSFYSVTQTDLQIILYFTSQRYFFLQRIFSHQSFSLDKYPPVKHFSVFPLHRPFPIHYIYLFRVFHLQSVFTFRSFLSSRIFALRSIFSSEYLPPPACFSLTV